MQSKGSELDFYFFCVAFWLFIRTLCGDLFVCRSFAMALAAATFPAIGGPCRRRQDLWCSTGAVSLSMCVFQCTLFLPSLPSNDCDHHQARIATHILLSPALPMCSKKVCVPPARPGTLLLPCHTVKWTKSCRRERLLIRTLAYEHTTAPAFEH